MPASNLVVIVLAILTDILIGNSCYDLAEVFLWVLGIMKESLAGLATIFICVKFCGSMVTVLMDIKTLSFFGNSLYNIYMGQEIVSHAFLYICNQDLLESFTPPK